jgi:hypothetical protein
MDRMKRFLVILALLALLVPAGATARIARARVWLSAESPLTVRGLGFKAHERVTVTVDADRNFVRKVTATATGSFVARWTGSVTGNGACPTILVRAAGDRGSRAVWHSVANDCANGPTP